ncbi:armadillo-type protein [Mycena metata]|uniref:Armadillo-type protein n=1 Tax=Mycena metata TaxID=1033252 RepID=A0AAD7K6H7_9AGAR|nr:armadillo-type protein [Mycena metata]
MLLKARAVDGIGLDALLLTLGILTYVCGHLDAQLLAHLLVTRHDPITANTIYRANTSVTLIEIAEAAESDDVASLAVWCLTRICRSVEVASGLLRQNIGKLLINKGLKSGQRTSRISAWCLGVLACSDGLADTLAELGAVPALCTHMKHCSESLAAGPEDYSPAVYAVARISRSAKISKALAKGGCVEMLAHFLITAENPRLLLWTALAVGCLMRPNSSEVAKALLDEGIARGLARLPNMLDAENIEALGAFAFAIQRFLSAERPSGTRKAFVEAGVVGSLLTALRFAADEPYYPQVHIELAYAIALLADVGGTSIRKQLVNGGIDVLKQIGASGGPDVAKACNLAVTSISRNVWSRNTGLFSISPARRPC